MTNRAAFAPGEAKEDWAIIRALSAHAGHTLPYDRSAGPRAAMAKVAPPLMRLQGREPAPTSSRRRRLGGAWRLARGRSVRRHHARLLSHQPDRAGLQQPWPSCSALEEELG